MNERTKSQDGKAAHLTDTLAHFLVGCQLDTARRAGSNLRRKRGGYGRCTYILSYLVINEFTSVKPCVAVQLIGDSIADGLAVAPGRG